MNYELNKHSHIGRSRNIPLVRFPEFKDEWEEKKLGEIATFSKGKGISKKDISENGINFCIRYGELYTKYSEVIDSVFSKTNIDTSNLVFSKKNDVIIPSSGETHIDIATASCVISDEVILGGDLNIIKTKNNGIFLSYYLNSKKKIEIANLSQGSSVIHLYSSSLSQLKLSIPSIPEQKRIANFFSVLDNKINELKEKKALLEEYKKGMMQKIFSQEIRFKPASAEAMAGGDDNGKGFPEWEEKKLGEISSNIMYGMNASAVKFDGTNRYLRITDIDENTRQYIPNPITSPKGKIEDKYKLIEGDIVFTRTGASVGKSYLYKNEDGNLLFAGFLIRFSIKEGNPYFIYTQTLMESYNRWVISMSMRSGQPGINAEEYKSYKLQFPSLPEQTKIANFLTKIDDKIKTVNEQIEESKEYKKGLLQRMYCEN